MIVGIGTDIIEVERIQKLLDKDTAFIEKIFTLAERAYCESKKHRAESYAARFAAKEAVFKALGTGWRGEMAFSEIEVVNDALGKPAIKMYGKVKEQAEALGIKNMQLSLSHIKAFAQAFVVLEK